MSGQLDGKVAIITGGASGIGLVTAKAFLKEGARVAIADIQDELGEQAVTELGDDAIYVHTDVTDDSSVAALVARTVERFGRLDIMFNNAGNTGDPASFTDVETDGIDKTLALLTRSVILGHKHAARQFEAQGGGGSILSTSSAAGVQGGWGALGYTTAKHAITGVVRAATAELSPKGIRSNAIAPGIIMTPLFARAYNVPMDESQDFLDFLMDELATTQPIGRVGIPDDIAAAAVFLSSDAASYITGVVLSVDGGATAVQQGSFAADMTDAVGRFNAR